jgi:hypothetical protein
LSSHFQKLQSACQLWGHNKVGNTIKELVTL